MTNPKRTQLAGEPASIPFLRRHARPVTALAALALGACSPSAPDPSGDPTPEPAPTPEPEESESVSILRPEIEPPEPDPTPEALPPFEAVIGFPEGGNTLDARAVATLEAALASPQMALGLPITLGAHSDSAGSDRSNLASSEKRGLAVAQWLIDKGVDPDRITVVAFGEQNPIEPNALTDGTVNEAGRAANRRVEITIAATAKEDAPTPASAADAPGAKPTSVEAGD